MQVESARAGVQVRRLGVVPYEPIWQTMQDFTATRDAGTPDQVWLLQHPPVFTQGQSGKAEHVLRDIGIPVVQIDRGGQVTYHGPGQLVAYLLIDLVRRGLKVREMVQLMEQSLIDCLASYGVHARRKEGAPGVYVADDKIAALGLRVRHGCSYHGLALNVDVDLAPYTAINPCGYAGLRTVRMADYGVTDDVDTVASRWLPYFLDALPAQRVPQR